MQSGVEEKPQDTVPRPWIAVIVLPCELGEVTQPLPASQGFSSLTYYHQWS